MEISLSEEVSRRVGATRRNLAFLNRDGTVRPELENDPGPNGPVHAITLDHEGGIWIGGEFTEVNTRPRAGVARLFFTGSLDPMPGAPVLSWSGRVNALTTRSSGQIVIGGRMVEATSAVTRGILQIDPTGRLNETGWQVGLPSLQSEVLALALHEDDHLTFAGNFSAVTVQGSTTYRHSLAKIKPDASLDLAFDPDGGPAGFQSNEAIRSLALEADGNLLVAGGFTWMNSLLRNGVARLIGTNPPSASYTRLPNLFIPTGPDARELNRYPLSVFISSEDSPSSAFTFSIEGGPPTLSINATNGQITWIPGEAEGPGVARFAVVARDSRSPGTEIRQAVEVPIVEVNQPGSITPIPPQKLVLGEKLTLQLDALDPDIPANTLRFWLGRFAPTGATLDATTGVFTWMAEPNQLGEHTVEIVVSDDGYPPMYATQSFKINVFTPPAPPEIEKIFFDGKRIRLRVHQSPSVAYQVEWSADLTHWEFLTSWEADTNAVSIDISSQTTSYLFYRLRMP